MTCRQAGRQASRQVGGRESSCWVVSTDRTWVVSHLAVWLANAGGRSKCN